MQGIFSSPIYAFVESIGVPFIAVFFCWLLRGDPVFFHHLLSGLAAFALLCFFRQGNDHCANDTALSGVLLPLLYIALLKLQLRIEGLARARWLRGIFAAFGFAQMAVIVGSGIVALSRASASQVPGFSSNAIAFSRALVTQLPDSAVVMSGFNGMSPVAALAGKQLVIGRHDDLWRRGASIANASRLHETILHNGAEVMLAESIEFLVEYKAAPVLLNNQSQLHYFYVMAQNDEWVLLKLNIGALLK
jgi:hypothetical protein